METSLVLEGDAFQPVLCITASGKITIRLYRSSMSSRDDRSSGEELPLHTGPVAPNRLTLNVRNFAAESPRLLLHGDETISAKNRCHPLNTADPACSHLRRPSTMHFVLQATLSIQDMGIQTSWSGDLVAQDSEASFQWNRSSARFAVAALRHCNFAPSPQSMSKLCRSSKNH